MRPLLALLTLLPLLVPSAPAAADDPAQSGAEAVGKVAAIEGKVTATLGNDTRRMERGEAVYRGDWIETESDARAKVRLHDDTEMVVGPKSRIHIDEFVYDTGSDQGKVLVEMGVGLLRFTTGVLEPESYEVKTPVASIGVRGTIFDVIVAAVDFATTVILREGRIVVTGVARSTTLQKPDQASDVGGLGQEPSEARDATDEEERETDPLKRPFRDEIQSNRNRPNLPAGVTKPSAPSVPVTPRTSPGGYSPPSPSPSPPVSPPRGRYP